MAKVRASIFYYKNMNPRNSNVYHKLHRDLRAEDTKIVYINKEFFDKNWEYVSSQDINPPYMQSMETIFHLYNTRLHPLATPEGQKRLREKGVKHTSMSVGDIIRVGNNNYIVADIGFKKIVFGANPRRTP